MDCYRLADLGIVLGKQGAKEYTKVSYPVRYGSFSEISTPDYLCQFNLNGELRFIQGRGRDWPHPAEWLKRTAGGDWVYYSAGEYREVLDLFGEYYVPRLAYRSNAIFESDPFEHSTVQAAIKAWGPLCMRLKGMVAAIQQGPLKDLLARVCRHDPQRLAQRADRLHALLGGWVTVLPPETRHVDYDVIPVVVADGCLYHCGFCTVKSSEAFRIRTPLEIREQIEGLQELYGADLRNYNSIFLAHRDALAAGREAIEFAAILAYEALGIAESLIEGPKLFLFASVDSLLHSGPAVFDVIQGLPFRTHINVGLESADPETLRVLGKPVPARVVQAAFERMLEINESYPGIEISANFVIGGPLPRGHLPSLVSLTREKLSRFREKGSIYLSPLANGGGRWQGGKRELLGQFREVKMRARLPTFLYLIQRL